MAVTKFPELVHIIRVMHKNGKALLGQEKVPIADLGFEADLFIPLALIFYKFKIGPVAFTLAKRRGGANQKQTGDE